METIIYQGREVECAVIDEINTVYGHGTDTLLRDEDGRYYLARHHEPWDGGYSEVHRMSLKAAILWAIQFCCKARPLRNDTWAALTSLTTLDRGLRTAKAPGRIVELDDRAQDLVERYHEEHRADHEARGIEPADIVNGAVRAILESDLEGVTVFAADVERAMRLRCFNIGDDDYEEAEHPEEATNTEEAANTEAKTRFVFKFRATRQHYARYREIELTAAEMETARTVASAFRLKPRAFLRRLVSQDLPGQPYNSGEERWSLTEKLRAEHIAFACFDEDLLTRIKRAAQAAGETVDGYVALAVAGYVDGEEQHMVVHPQTGELLYGNGQDFYSEVVSITCETDAELENRLADVRARKKTVVRFLNPDGSVFAEPAFSTETWATLEEMARKMGMDVGPAIKRLIEEGVSKEWRKRTSDVNLGENSAGRRKRHDPANVALLAAAAAPEPAEDDEAPAGKEPPRVELDGEQMPDYEGDSQDGKEAQ